MTMTKCNHEWVQLTNLALEERLLGDRHGWDNIWGCKLCGDIKDGGGTLLSNFNAVHTYVGKIGAYWNALQRFRGR